MAILVSQPVVDRPSSRPDAYPVPVDVVDVARLDATTLVPIDDASRAEAYPPGSWCAYRRVLIRRSGRVLEVTRWAHNGTSWLSLTGVLDGWTSRAVVRVLRSEDRSVSVVVNAGGLTDVDLSCLADLVMVFKAVGDRGVILDLVEASPELTVALAEVTRPTSDPLLPTESLVGLPSGVGGGGEADSPSTRIRPWSQFAPDSGAHNPPAYHG